MPDLCSISLSHLIDFVPFFNHASFHFANFPNSPRTVRWSVRRDQSCQLCITSGRSNFSNAIKQVGCGVFLSGVSRVGGLGLAGISYNAN